jgi:hypothetical protein
MTQRKAYHRAESAPPPGPKKKAVEPKPERPQRPGTRIVTASVTANVCGAQRLMVITLPKEPWA